MSSRGLRRWNLGAGLRDLWTATFGSLERTEAGETGRLRFAHGRDEVSRTAIINHLAARTKARRYLEIGVRDGHNLRRIRIPEKVGVDPVANPAVTHQMTSDDFFARHPDMWFDIIFIDGMHLEDFVVRDVENALRCLNEGGHIVVHDCNPPTEFHQRENYEVDGGFPPWNGTVWRGWLRFRATRPDLSMEVVDADYGVGMIKRGSQMLIDNWDISYDEFQNRREELLPLISIRHFIRNY